MAYKTKQLTALFDNPSQTANVLFPLVTGTELTFAGEKSPDGQWAKVNPPIGAPSAGWLFLAHADEIPDVRPDVSPDAFVRTSILAERSFNSRPTTAPYFVAADFVIARALFETNLANLPPQIPGSDGVGPLQVSTSEWTDFLTNGADFAAEFDNTDRDHPTEQIFGATYRMYADAKKVSKAKLDAGVGTADQPPLPSNLEVFLAYLTNSAKAAAALFDATSTAASKGQTDGAGVPAPASPNAAKPLKDFLTGLMTDAEITAFFTARPKLTGPIGNSTKVGDFVSNVETILNTALKDAFDKIKEFVPDELPVVSSGQAPWFAVATARRLAASRSRILDLGIFQIDQFSDQHDEHTVVRGIRFVLHEEQRQLHSGGQRANSSSGTRGDLENLGKCPAAQLQRRSDRSGRGLVPTEKNDSSGHVAFFARGDANSVTLLGGNQSDQVKESTFSRSRVVALRWLDVAPAAPAGPAGNAPINMAGLSASQQQMANLIVSKFAAAGYGKVQQIAAVANAKAESSLNPNAQTVTSRESSFGLFQCNTRGGLGTGHTEAELKDPNKNIDIIIAETKKFPSFGRATTLKDAVDAFVDFIERPANGGAEKAKRLGFAQSLME